MFQKTMTDKDESEGLPFIEVKREWVRNNLSSFDKYPEILPYVSKKRMFEEYDHGVRKPVIETDKTQESGHECLFGDPDGNHDALFGRLNPEPDNEH